MPNLSIDNQLVMKSTLSCLPDEDENSPYKALIISKFYEGFFFNIKT